MLLKLFDGLELVVRGDFNAFRKMLCSSLKVGIVIFDEGAISAVGFMTPLGEIKTGLIGRNTEEF